MITQLFRRCYRSIITVTYILFYAQAVQAQNVNDSLIRRIDSLEAKMARIERRIGHPEPQRRTQTRSSLESGRYGGFVVADVFNTKLTIGGFVQGDFIYDIKQPGAKDAFTPSFIPISNEDKGQLTFSPRQTRFTIASASETRLGQLTTILELDLFNSNGTAVPRLRHAWGQLGKWGGGQYWSTFMDIDVFPNILDYQGPNAMVLVRQVQLRFTQPLNKKSTLALSVENPGSDTRFPVDSGLNSRALFPDVVAQYRYNFSSASHIQLAGLFHPVTYDNYIRREKTNIGWGFNLTGVVEVSAKAKDNVVCQATYGQGIARYFNDLGGQGYDAATKNRTEAENIPVLALMGFYDHWWSDKLSTTIGYGYLKLDNKSYQPGIDFKSTQYGVVNLLYYPSAFVKVGIEYLYGKRITIDNQYGDNSRLQFSTMYKF